MAPKIGINLWNWTPRFTDADLGLIDKAAAIGYDAVEIGMNDFGFDQKAVARRAKDAGVELALCGAFTAGRDISNFDPAVRAATRVYFADCFRAAEAMGARVFAGPIYAGGGKARLLSADDAKREWDLAVEGLRDMAGLAQKSGVTLGLEPLQRYRSSVVNTVAQAMAMIREIGHPSIGIHFDTYHANIEEADPVGALNEALAAGLLVHFHSCENHRGAPGTGHIPWAQMLGSLAAAGYRGHVTIEAFAPGGMEAIWRPLASSPDELASSGLAFLRRGLADAEAAHGKNK